MSQAFLTSSKQQQSLKGLLQVLLNEAGIKINGNQAGDIKIHNEEFYQRVFREHSIGVGESYMDGWWDCEQLDVFFERCLNAKLDQKIKQHWWLLLRNITNLLFNAQTQHRSKKVAEQHYNLDNELYSFMLGESMAYTCAYWKEANTLDQAQYQKYDLVCRKLNLSESDNILELGCGWGGFAHYATTHYGCKIVAVNIAAEQLNYAKNLCANLPVEFYLADYRARDFYNPKNKLFDKIISLGLCEHVGQKNYATFMQIARQNLKTDGLFLLHTIGSNISKVNTDAWTNKYIFPNGMLPSISQLGKSMENLFIMEDWHNFGADYDKTLMAWHNNFQQHWPQISHKFGPRFYRMWVYYLLSCAGMFRSRSGQLWQLVLSPNGVKGGYQSIR